MCNYVTYNRFYNLLFFTFIFAVLLLNYYHYCSVIDYIVVYLKIVEKKSGQHGRLKMLKEIETFHHCQGHENILQLIEYFEEEKL